MRLRFVIIAVTYVGLSASAFGQVYKWVDERGLVHYGDKPPAKRSATEIVAPTPAPSAAPAPATPAVPATPVNGTWADCTSRICEMVKQVDPECNSSYCIEAKSIPADCHTIKCQGQRAELEKKVAQLRDARMNATRAEADRQRQTDPDAEAKARAIARCKASRGTNCEDPRVTDDWMREDKPITNQERIDAVNERRRRNACRGVKGFGCE
jgi:hypothetical protein